VLARKALVTAHGSAPGGAAPFAATRERANLQPAQRGTSPAQSTRAVVVPPVYRLQLTPKVLQSKTASVARKRRMPKVPSVYRPETKKAVQPKASRVAAPAFFRPSTL